ncbi:MAG: hypothetical protein EA351_02560, partial [Gemmatimonadales bacterium]
MIQATPADSTSRPRLWPAALAAIGGGGAVIIGTFLPWMTLFAGLYEYPGITGLNGWLVLAGGVLAVVAGGWLLLRPGLIPGHLTGLLGLTLLGWSLWLVVQQRALLEELLVHHPMTAAGLGPGLLVVACGAFL